ncbi:MAG TPA: type II CAAX endopeptidase family protein [Anaerolineae bacterium]|jgi:membrane protease YdiL (CAAX protease family)|nr:type II CAAX endopeptidase family protein [Anaerolineae bacterium]
MIVGYDAIGPDNNRKDTSRPGEEGTTSPSRIEQLVEALIFLFLIVPSMVLSFFAVRQGSLSFVLIAFSTISRDLALVFLILFFAWRNGEPISKLGLTFRNGWGDIVLGVALFIPFTFITGLLESVLRAAGLSTPSTPLPSFLAVRGLAQILLAFILVIIVALAEETIFRGYLILRFTAVTKSLAAAVLLSAVIFSLGHGYEGSAGVVIVGFMGLVFALIYLWRKSLVAPITMHFLQDFIAILLLPLLGMR